MGSEGMRLLRVAMFLLIVSSLCILPAMSKAAAGKEKKSKAFIDPMEHDIHVVSKTNFDTVIRKLREGKTSAVLHYTKNDECKKLINGIYNELAKDLKGMVKIAAIDCDENEKTCKDNNVKDYPTIVVFPPNPIPAFPYTGKLEKKPLTTQLTRFISGHVKTLEPKGIDAFLTQHIAVPKVVLFSDKKATPPLLLRALSAEFKDKLDFGFIDAKKDENKDIISKYKVTKYPTVLLFRPAQGAKGKKANPEGYEPYKGEMKFSPLFEWLNVYSETFVKGGGFDTKGKGGGDVSDAKPWLIQPVPELTKQSSHDVCFKQQGLCVVYLKQGAITTAEEQMLTGLKDQFTSQLGERGVNFFWMWLDTAVEKEFAEMFKVPPHAPDASLPSVVVFNNKKAKKRYMKLDEEKTADRDTIKGLVDKIMGGDARFQNLKELPKWAERTPADGKQEGKQEL